MDNLTTNNERIPEGFVGQRMVLVSAVNRKQMGSNALSAQLYATAIGYYPLASHHDRERTTGSQEYILIYCVDGKGWIDIDGTQHEILPNSFYIIPQKVPHHYASSVKVPWSIYWLHFTGSQAQLLFNSYTQITNTNGHYIAYDENRVAQFNYLTDVLENDMSSTMAEAVYIKTLSLLGSFIYVEPNTPDGDTDSIAESVTLMKQNLKTNFQISEFAARANYSVSRYTELFRKRTGYAPIQYFIQLKIHKACQYLCFTKMNIKQICNELGFDDPYYFSRIFKKHIGHSPLSYRKRYRTSQVD